VPPHPLDQPLAIDSEPSADRELELALADEAPFNVLEQMVPLRILGQEVQDGARRKVLSEAECPVRLEKVAG
jgi:hypothetical protein